MLDLTGRNFRLCDRLSRRSFLRIGGFGAGMAGLRGAGLAGAGLGGLTLDQLIHVRRAQGGTGRGGTAAILFWMAGGPSHIDMYDMKPDAPAEVRGPFRPIETSLPGLLVNERMPRHAPIARHLSVIRSISHHLSVHDDGSHWLQTGYPLLNARAAGQQYPCEGSVVSYLRGAARPDVPPYVCIPEDYQTHLGFYQTAAFLGKRFEALNAGRDERNQKYGGPAFATPQEISVDRLGERRQLLDQFDAYRRLLDASSALRDADDVQRQAFELMGSETVRRAFDVEREPASIRERYGDHLWGRAALLARRLVEAGTVFVTINLYEKDVDWWDDHYTIEKNLDARLPRYDQALSALIEDLHERGMAESVLVAAYGEFGRAPRIDSGAGRGHWPKAMSAVLSGGGIRPGQIIGATTRDGAEPRDRPLGPGDLLATIYQALGISAEQTVPDRLQRPIPIVPHGRPIRELIS